MTPKQKRIARNVAAVLTGLAGGVSVIMLVEMFGMPGPPPVPDPILAELRPHYSIGALLIVELAYVFGSMAAGATAGELGVGEPLVLAAIAGGVLMLGGIANLVLLPHPAWFTVVSMLTFIPMAVFGEWFVRRKLSEEVRG